MKPDTRIKLFFITFGTVYFLESIGGFYMTSAVVFIEKQFQIPSRMAGTMVSAGDFAYIPVVVFTSYFGGKGNRARWIGAGCMLIAIANLLISSSNFLFPKEEFHLDADTVPSTLTYEVSKLTVPPYWDQFNDTSEFIDILNKTDINGEVLDYNGRVANSSAPGPFFQYQKYCFDNSEKTVCRSIQELMSDRLGEHVEEYVSRVRILSALPFSFCHATINRLRQQNKAAECAMDKDSSGPFIMIFCGLLILGVGRTMPFSLGLPLMDDNVKKKNLPVYFAGMFFVKILGPILGLLTGSVLNKIYVNFEPPQGLSPLDPMWIGCWWLGFLIFGVILFFPSLALFLFPSDSLAEAENADEHELETLSNGEVVKKKKQKRLNLVDKHVRRTSTGEAFMPETVQDKIKDFLETMKCLLKTPIYIGALCGRIVDVLAFKGFFVFLGKYMEIQFGVPQHIIQRFMAVTGTLGFAGGVASGAIALKVFKMQGRKAAAWVAVSSLMAALLCFLNTSVGCESVLGVIGKQAMDTNQTFPMCRPECACDEMPLYPVCNTKGEVFYSPCHAGCPLQGANFTLFSKDRASNLTFTDCSCSNTDDGIVGRDFCPTADCDFKFKLYFFNQAIGAFFGGMSVVPGMLIILRSVKPEHRSVSLGFNGFLVSLLATLPSPIFWGKIFDWSCAVWRTTCNSTGACTLYDNDQLRISIHLIYGGMRMFSLISDLWVLYFAKGLKLTDEEEPEQVPEEEKVRERKLTKEAVQLMKALEED